MEEHRRCPTSQSEIRRRHPSFSDRPIASDNAPGSALFSAAGDAFDDPHKGPINHMGFLDHDYGSSSFIFEDLLQNITAGPSMIDSMSIAVPPPPPPQPSVPESSEVVSTPATLSSPCSMSSSSSGSKKKSKTVEEGDDDDEEEDDEEGDDDEKTKKQMKIKKNNQKRQREPRFAFMTKSDIDNLDDGYRWRKYGQKAVKNSPFPRSYYRCTSAACGVKKRVERSSDDPSTVVTTYEGTHTHPCPVAPRGAFAFLTPSAAGGTSSISHFPAPQLLHLQHHHQLPQPNTLSQSQQPYFHNFTPQPQPQPPLTSAGANYTTNPTVFPPLFPVDRPFRPSSSNAPSSSSSSSVARDHGLLQDMLPSQVLKGPKGE